MAVVRGLSGARPGDRRREAHLPAAAAHVADREGRVINGTPIVGASEGIARELEVATAQRDAALSALDALERMVTRAGGFMTHEQQQVLMDARFVLEDAGHRKRREQTWRNR